MTNAEKIPKKVHEPLDCSALTHKLTSRQLNLERLKRQLSLEESFQFVTMILC